MIQLENHPTFTDHAIVTCYTTYQTSGQDAFREKSYLCDTGRRYGNLDFHKAPWQEVKQELSSKDWSDMMKTAKEDPTEALKKFHDIVLMVLEKLVPVRKPFSRYRMPK